MDNAKVYLLKGFHLYITHGVKFNAPLFNPVCKFIENNDNFVLTPKIRIEYFWYAFHIYYAGNVKNHYSNSDVHLSRHISFLYTHTVLKIS